MTHPSSDGFWGGAELAFSNLSISALNLVGLLLSAVLLSGGGFNPGMKGTGEGESDFSLLSL